MAKRGLYFNLVQQQEKYVHAPAAPVLPETEENNEANTNSFNDNSKKENVSTLNSENGSHDSKTKQRPKMVHG